MGCKDFSSKNFEGFEIDINWVLIRHLITVQYPGKKDDFNEIIYNQLKKIRNGIWNNLL